MAQCGKGIEDAIEMLCEAEHLILAVAGYLTESDQDEILDHAVDCRIVSDYLKSLAAHNVPICLTGYEVLAEYPAIADNIIAASIEILHGTNQQ